MEGSATKYLQVLVLSTPNPQYGVVYFKAKVQQEMGDKKGALKAAYKALEVAKTAKSKNYYIIPDEVLMNELK